MSSQKPETNARDALLAEILGDVNTLDINVKRLVESVSTATDDIKAAGNEAAANIHIALRKAIRESAKQLQPVSQQRFSYKKGLLFSLIGMVIGSGITYIAMMLLSPDSELCHAVLNALPQLDQSTRDILSRLIYGQ